MASHVYRVRRSWRHGSCARRKKDEERKGDESSEDSDDEEGYTFKHDDNGVVEGATSLSNLPS